MKQCEQTKGLSVLAHGESVERYLFDLLDHLDKGTPLQAEWKLPDWLLENKDLILSELPDRETLSLYTRFHDIGKPFCREIDQDGRVHFHNHVEISYNVFLKNFENVQAAELIRRDMDIHLLKAEGVNEFAEKPYALTLLITGLSEIHSNAQMFGGMDSVSFKIKWKAINQRGKQIITIKKKQNEK